MRSSRSDRYASIAAEKELNEKSGFEHGGHEEHEV